MSLKVQIILKNIVCSSHNINPSLKKNFSFFFLPPNRGFFMPLRYVVEKLRKETIEIQLNELTITTKRV